MKNKKLISCCTLALCMVFALSLTAFAASESIDGGSGSWYGGIIEAADEKDNRIYSKVWDHKVDGRRYTVTVWVKDDNGDKDSVTGTTNAVDAAGEVKVTKIASYDHWYRPNKAGYKDLSIVTSRAANADSSMLDPSTPTSFEVELWDEVRDK